MTDPFETITTEIVRRLKDVIARTYIDSILFSGGVDTSVLAALLPEAKTKKAITITLDAQGDDLIHAETLARHLGLSFEHLPVTVQEAIAAIPSLIKILDSFDPALPNDLVVYFGMKRLKEAGVNSVMTGDGADEIFAGYDFMQEMADVDTYIRRIEPRMEFSSNVIARHFGIGLVQPFLDPEFVRFALTIPIDLKIRRVNGKTWGKWILRKAFETLLPPDSVWQTKRPLEYGSGMHRLRQVIEAKVSDGQTGNDYGTMRFINKEHLYYYGIYREVVGKVPEAEPGQKPCPACGAGMDVKAFHCRVCGGVLEWRT